mgnify:CR=1 FL=1
MIRLAVVGDIGSGKSYIAKQFGYPVFNADREVAKIYKKNRKCYNKLKKALPNYITSFPVKKTELIKAIISNNYNLKKIIKIIHPEVRYKMNRFVNKNKNKRFIVLDIPLLMENKLNKKNDILIFVDSKIAQINTRLKKRKNYNKKILENLRKVQKPLAHKKKLSTYVIKNDFRLLTIKKRVKFIKKQILYDRNST